MVTGLDTDENLRLFLGRNGEELGKDRDQLQVYVHLPPLPDFPVNWLDERSPLFSPRPPTAAEMVEANKLASQSY